MLKVAVTGNAGSGKSVVCDRFREKGVTVISTDNLAREAVSPGSPLLTVIAERFGERMITPEGGLNRRRLRQAIVADEHKRRALEQILHPEILERMNQKLSELEMQNAAMAVIEIPLLFECDLVNHFDVIVTVSADREVKIKRLMKRDGVCRTDAEALLHAQAPDRKKTERSDFVIINNDSRAQVMKAADRIFAILNENITKTA